jgi:plastocyanin
MIFKGLFMKNIKSLSIMMSIGLLVVSIDAGTLKGHVKYDGKAPKKKKLRMDADPVCGSSHSSPVLSENFKMASDGSMAEALVYLKNVKYNGGVPSEPAVLDQKGCIYMPHVFGMVAGQELLIKNSDATLHNIHSMPKVNKEFNFAMPKVVKEKKATFSKSEPDPFYIKCDVHPWMKTWVLVSDHPYFAVTDAKGNFSIEGIPAGTYEVVCWQEKFGKRTLTAEVTIGEGDTTKDFVFTRPKKK